MNNKLIKLLLISIISISMVGCKGKEEEQTEDTTKTEATEEAKTEDTKKSEEKSSEEKTSEDKSTKEQKENTDNKIDLTNLDSYETVEKAYDENLQKIMKGEKIQNLDSSKINLEEIIKKAEKAKELSSSAKTSEDKIYAIGKVVSLDDLANNTTKEILTETLNYVLGEYESGAFFENLEKNLYLTRYLNNATKKQSMTTENELSFSLYQIAKDTLRMNDKEFKTKTKEELTQIIELNKNEVKTKIEALKSSSSEKTTEEEKPKEESTESSKKQENTQSNEASTSKDDAQLIVYVNKGESESNIYHKSKDAHKMEGAIEMTKEEAEKNKYRACKANECFK